MTAAPTFSIIIPTCGRTTLRRTLAGLRAMQPGDEVLICGDGPQPVAERIVAEAGPFCRYLPCPRTADTGATQRNLGIESARGDYLLFIDDDDWYVPGALDIVRRGCAAHPGRAFLYRMYQPFQRGLILWTVRALRLGNISTQMFVCPRIPDRVARWNTRWGHDLDFVVDTLRLLDEPVIWRPEIIACIGHGNEEFAPETEVPTGVRKAVGLAISGVRIVVASWRRGRRGRRNVA
jgi:glycosyltransferase involved in cell wall biosynthesis